MLRVPVSGLAVGARVLPSEAARYVARVHRARVGDSVMLVDGAAAQEAIARIVSVTADGVTVDIAEPAAASKLAQREIVVVQAIGKADKMDAIVRDATELGATRLQPVVTSRTVVRLGAREEARTERWRRIAREAARQCGRGDELAVDAPCAFESAVADIAATRRIVLIPDGSLPARDVFGLSGSVALLVGPEGGLAPEEVALAVEAGWLAVSLGPLVLRMETVAAAALGALMVWGTPPPDGAT